MLYLSRMSFFVCLFVCLSVCFCFVLYCFCAVSLKASTQFPIAFLVLPEPSPLIFKVLDFQSYWIRTQEIQPLWFSIQMLWGFIFSVQATLCGSLFLFPPHNCSSLPSVARPMGFSFPPHFFSSCFLWHGLFSIFCSGVFFCQSSGHVPCYLHCCVCYLVVFYKMS